MKLTVTPFLPFRAPAIAAVALALSTVAAFATPVTTTVGYDPNAPTSNFTAPNPTDNTVAYTVTLDSDASNLYVTLQANPAGQGLDSWTTADSFANLYFGTGIDYNQGATLGIEVENMDAFIPGGANGPKDLQLYGVTQTTIIGTDYGPGSPTAVGTTIELSLPWTYLETDPEQLGFATLSAANPNVELRDTQSLSYSYVGGSTFGTNRFGVESDPNFVAAAPEPSTWMTLLAGGLVMGFAYRRRSNNLRAENRVS